MTEGDGGRWEDPARTSVRGETPKGSATEWDLVPQAPRSQLNKEAYGYYRHCEKDQFAETQQTHPRVCLCHQIIGGNYGLNISTCQGDKIPRTRRNGRPADRKDLDLFTQRGK